MNNSDKTIRDDALVMVQIRNEFYRSKFRFMLGVYTLSLIVNLVLIGMIIYLKNHPTKPLYFPADPLGRLIKVVPLQYPNLSLPEIANWTVEAVESAYSYDFVNYRAQLQNAQKYFTDYGWRNYMKALAASNNFKALTARKFIIIAKVIEPPRLLTQGALAGADAWKFELHMLVTYLLPPFDFSDASKFTNPLVVTAIVQRQNLLQSYKGLGIVQLIVSFDTRVPVQNAT